jgi:hypothetical protein
VEQHSTLVTPEAVQPPRMHTTDVVASGLLLCVHLALAMIIAVMAPLLVMGTDACAYEQCGDQQWVTHQLGRGAAGEEFQCGELVGANCGQTGHVCEATA